MEIIATTDYYFSFNCGPVYEVLQIVDAGWAKVKCAPRHYHPTLPGPFVQGHEEQRLYPPFSVFHLYVGYPPDWGKQPR